MPSQVFGCGLHNIYPKDNVSECNVEGVKVRLLPVSKNSGIASLIADALALVYGSRHDVILLLGPKVVPIAILLNSLFRRRLIVNTGGIEWLRPQFSCLTKLYLKLCFYLATRYSDIVILDNQSYFKFVKSTVQRRCIYIPYGGDISYELSADQVKDEFPFIKNKYFLSVSRSIEDNMIAELCETFRSPDCSHLQLVLVSNFSNSEYGRETFTKYQNCDNITLIDGLYDKHKLDCIRRMADAYIHTHTLCGTAPSLVEAMTSGVPIISNNLSQNRYTTANTAIYFNDYQELVAVLNGDYSNGVMPPKVMRRYEWSEIVKAYEGAILNLTLSGYD